VRIGNKSRIFKIIKTPVPYNEHPIECQELLGYEFYHEEPNDPERFNEFLPEKGTPYYQQYWAKLEDVAQNLKQTIKYFEKPQKYNIESSLQTKPEKIIYLAETTSDLSEARDNIRRNLEQLGYTILPEEPLPFLLKYGSYKEKVCECLKHCNLSLHLIGNNYGLIPEGESNSVIDIQQEMAATCEEVLTSLIWLPPKLKIKDQRQVEFISMLKNEASGQRGAELIIKRLEEFKTRIMEVLNKQRHTRTISTQNCPISIYLIYDKTDKEAIKPLDDYLYNQGFEVMQPFFSDSETNLRKMHQDKLTFCDAILIYYEHANDSWFEFKIMDIRKLSGFNRSKPLLAKAIYISGEKTVYKDSFRTHEAIVIKNYSTFTGDILNDFTLKIKENY